MAWWAFLFEKMFVELPVNVLVGIEPEEAERLQKAGIFNQDRYEVEVKTNSFNVNRIEWIEEGRQSNVCCIMLASGMGVEIPLSREKVIEKINKPISFLN